MFRTCCLFAVGKRISEMCLSSSQPERSLAEFLLTRRALCRVGTLRSIQTQRYRRDDEGRVALFWELEMKLLTAWETAVKSSSLCRSIGQEGK